jgi:hypothetical protein
MKRIIIAVIAFHSVFSARPEAQFVNYLSSTMYTGDINSIQADDNFIFCTGSNSFQIFYMSDSGRPILFSGYPFSSTTHDVKIAGNFAYIAAGDTGLAVIDFSTLPILEIHGVCNTPGCAYKVFIQGNRAFVADGDSGLQIIDISNPARPTLVGGCSLPGRVIDIFLHGDYAYLINGALGLLAVDISDPTHPVYRGNTPFAWEATDLYIDGGYAYVLTYHEDAPVMYGQMIILDLSDPAEPEIVSSSQNEEALYDIYVQNEYAFISDITGLLIYNISDPTSPFWVGSLLGDDLSSYCVIAYGEFAYLGGFKKLQTILITDPSQPQLIAAYEIPYAIQKLCFANDHAYTGHLLGFGIIDMHNVEYPMIAAYKTNLGPTNIWDIELAGNYAYLAGSMGSLQIVDISDPLNPIMVGYFSGIGSYGVHVVDSLALATCLPRPHFRIYNVSDPANPQLLGSNNLSGTDICAFDNYAYIADREILNIIDFSDPTDPVLVNSLQTPDSIKCIFISDTLAYIAYGSGLLRIFDISDPVNPALLSSYEAEIVAEDIFVSDGIAYLAGGDLEVVSVENPEQPLFIVSYETPGRATGVYV